MGLHRAAVGIGGAIEHRRIFSCHRGRRRRCHCRRRGRSRSRRRRILRCNQATNVE